MLNAKDLSELAYDVQSGLGRVDVPDFDRMRILGMAANLSIHIRGLGEIKYEVLRKVSDHFFSIPSYALKEVVTILAEVEFVKLMQGKGQINSIIPNIPKFIDVYEGIGSYFSFSEMNEHEQGTLLILSKLKNKADNRDKLFTEIGTEKILWDRCLKIGEGGNYLRSYRARGKDILVSPIYFADNLDSLTDLTAKFGSKDIQVVLEMIRKNQGWPLSLIEKGLGISGHALSENQRLILIYLCQEGVLKPPSISFNSQVESFVFTPAPGKNRLNPANREIYERAMALVSSVRKGQLLPSEYKILYPKAILKSLKNKGYIGSNSEAISQYANLVHLKVGYLKQVSSNKWQFHLRPIDENVEALDLALKLLETGSTTNLEVSQEARIALSKDEKYIQSLVSSAELKARNKIELDIESKNNFEQLLLEM